MNLPVTQNIQLPAHLQALATKQGLAQNVVGGIISGASFHSIGVKAARWRLNDPQGEEKVVPSHHLDVIILDGNPNLSRKFYAGAYDPAGEAKAPDCFSDNGVGPSVRAAKPQCGTCAACPNNVLGSKINPNGAKSKACSDTKTLAVILAENPTGPVYQLQVPHMSQKNLKIFGDQLFKRGIPLAGVVVRLTFDTSADYPLIVFEPASYTTPEQGAAVEEVLDSEEVDAVTNKNDAAINSATVAALPAPAIAQFALPPMLQAAEKVPDTQLAPSGGVSQIPAKRTRRTKAEIAAANEAAPAVPQPATVAQPSAAADFFNRVSTTASALTTAKTVPQINSNPQPTGSALDAALAEAFKL